MSLSNCATAQPPTDSFCQIYNEIIQQKGDGKIVATPGVKRRILINEDIYRTQCWGKDQ